MAHVLGILARRCEHCENLAVSDLKRLSTTDLVYHPHFRGKKPQAQSKHRCASDLRPLLFSI